MEYSAENASITNVRLTHKTSCVELIEKMAFQEPRKVLDTITEVDECVILQTCNRTELYIVTRNPEEATKKIKEFLMKRCENKAEEVDKAIEVATNSKALKHLLRVTSGLESMVVGEDQILGQVWDAYSTAEAVNAAGPILRTVFTRALTVGRRVRNETEINRGSVSIGSAAVELAETLLGGLKEKNVSVMGAGEMGTLVAKALSRCSPNAIFIANRTYERAVKLAKELNGKAVKFDKLEDMLKDADVVICSTSAPHYLLKRDNVYKIMEQRNREGSLMIMDISNPRNVEESIQEIDGVELYNIDDLRVISEKNKEKRYEKAVKASELVEEALVSLIKELKAQSVNDVVSALFVHAEKVRKKEQTKALSMLGKVDEKEKRIINGLTFEIVEQTLVPIVENLREAARNGNKQTVEVALKLLELNKK